MKQTEDTLTQTSDNPVGNTDLNKIANEIYLANKEKGFGDRNTNVGEGLMLIVTELSEAMEAHREGDFAGVDDFYNRFVSRTDDIKVENWDRDVFAPIFKETIKDTYEDEIADALIRIFDWAGRKGIDLDFHVKQKLRYNKTRPHKHGKKY